MHANGREFMKRMQAQSVEIGAIHPPSHDGGYKLSSCLRKKADEANSAS